MVIDLAQTQQRWLVSRPQASALFDAYISHLTDPQAAGGLWLTALSATTSLENWHTIHY